MFRDRLVQVTENKKFLVCDNCDYEMTAENIHAYTCPEGWFIVTSDTGIASKTEHYCSVSCVISAFEDKQ